MTEGTRASQRPALRELLRNCVTVYALGSVSPCICYNFLGADDVRDEVASGRQKFCLFIWYPRRLVRTKARNAVGKVIRSHFRVDQYCSNVLGEFALQ